MRIILISDTHLAQVAKAFTANVDAAIDWIETQAADLVIHLGDVTADGAGDPSQFEHARRVLSRISAPLLALPGNHDVGENPPHGGVKEPAFDAGRLAAFRETLGDDYWVFQHDGWTLIGLDAQLFATGSHDEKAQADWLDAVLAGASGPIAVFLHKPMVLDHADQADEHPRFIPPASRRDLMQRLKGRDLRLVVSGHVHQHRRKVIDGIDYLWAPSAAFLLPDIIQERLGEKRVGLMTLELTRDGEIRAEMVRPSAMIDLDVLDHPEVYPQVRDIRRS